MGPSTAASLVEDELQDFRAVAVEFLGATAGSAQVRDVVAAGGDLDRGLALQAARMGWFGLEIPEDLGGAGAGFAELALLLEEAGAALASLPLVSSAVLAAGAIRAAGSDDQQRRWLPDLAEGAVFGTGVIGGAFGPESGEVVAEPNGSALLLRGTGSFVPDGRAADLFVVAARSVTGERVVGVVHRDAPGLRVEPLTMTDATRSLDAVHLEDVVLGEPDMLVRGTAADRLATALVNRVSVALAAEAVGIAARVLAMTVAYAGQRTQFGRPIGSFQAVKHQAADMHVDTEVGRELVRDAVRRVVEDPTSEATTVAASMAKARACETAARCAGVAVQLHGGIGYTWEHDLHLFLKRALLDEQLFGSPRWHRERVAALVLDGRDGLDLPASL